MKIAVFYNLNFGGAKRAVYEQVKRLKNLGHLIDVYTTDFQIDTLDISKVASNSYRYKYSSFDQKIPFLSRLVNDIKVFRFLNTLHAEIAHDIDSRKYDIVLVHPDKYTQSPYILRHLRTRNVYYCQEPLRIVFEYVLRAKMNVGLLKYIYELITRYIRKKIDIENVRSATFTIASCYHIRERMIEAYGVYPYVSYLGIDIETFRPLKIKKKNQVFFVGNKDVWNDGYELVQKSLELIPSKIRPKLKVVSWVKENNERLTENELVKQYNESFATLCLSRFETFGLVPLESLSCGTTVIATRVSGHRETIAEDSGGYLVEFDQNEIAKLIERLSKYKKSSIKARAYIKKYWDWDKKIIDLEKLLLFLSKYK